MSDRARRLILSVGGATCVAIVLLAYFVLLDDDPPSPRPVAGSSSQTPVPSAQDVAEGFAAAWARADHAAAGARTDQPRLAQATMTGVRQSLGAVDLAVALSGPVTESEGTATARTKVTWTLTADRTWSYTSELGLVREGAAWKVRWAPTIVHPKMGPGLSLALRVGSDVDVVDRDGEPLVRGGSALPAAGPVLGPGMARLSGDRADAGKAVVLVDAAGAEKAELAPAPGGAAEPYKSTLDIETQAAAQAAVDALAAPAYLVAIDSATGGIAAVAQNSAASGTHALNGLYPPGSTFKVVTAAAVLTAGAASAGTVLPCPGEDTIGTRRIRNDGFELGSVPLSTAFARSCNTTFAALAADLPAEALPAAAARFGFAADYAIPGTTTETGRVDAAGGTPEQVENSIGQGTVQASPFGLALMAATVASGDAVTPRLYTDLETEVNRGYKPPSPGTISALRSMMRAVVTSGTGSALSVHGSVAGKTGTAQFGDGTDAHGWFAGYRGDVAFAVLVEGAGSSGPAVSTAGRFLAGL